MRQKSCNSLDVRQYDEWRAGELPSGCVRVMIQKNDSLAPAAESAG